MPVAVAVALAVAVAVAVAVAFAVAVALRELWLAACGLQFVFSQVKAATSCS